VTNLDEPAEPEARTLTRHPGSVLRVLHCQERRLFATVHGSDMDHATTAARHQSPGKVSSVIIWDAATCREVGTLRLPDEGRGDCHDIALDSRFRRIALTRDDGTIEIRDTATLQLVRLLKGHQGFAWRVAFSLDGRLVASSGRDATVRVWDAESGKQILALPGVSDLITSLDFSRDGQRLAMAGANFDLIKPQIVRIWDVPSGSLVAQPGDSFDYATMAFHLDGRRLARSMGAGVFILETVSGRELFRLGWHTGSVTGMAFSPDGLRLASAAQDGTIKLWDVATGREILNLLHGREERLTGVSFSPDGFQIVSTSESGTVKVWDATPLPVHAGG
jgi:WD40 repeat protein